MNTQSVHVVIGVIIAIAGYYLYNQPLSSTIGFILIAFGVLCVLFSGYKSQNF